MYAWLGSIQIGVTPFTGPTKQSIKEKSTLSRIAVAEGKPVVQDMGDELDTQTLKFFFDETFCDPEAELQKLRDARAAREPLPYVPGSGDYSGARYVVEEISGDIQKTTLGGRVVRIEVDVQLLEAPVRDLGALNKLLAVGAAYALAPAAALSVLVKSR
ncbi:MAG: phage tail protein [Rhodoblastus sp.]